MNVPMWYHPKEDMSSEQLEKDVRQMRNAGVDAALTYVYTGHRANFLSTIVAHGETDVLARLIPIARACGLEVHPTLVLLNGAAKDVMDAHPEWYVVSREGVSCVEKPPYIEGYRWFCPSREEPREFVRRIVEELASGYDVQGIHLDYIRYPDVILPKGIQPRYGIVQDREFPEYDYCYCSRCRALFADQEGIDPLEIRDEETRARWNRFRYDRIGSLVGELYELAHTHDKLLSAAVFATPELSRRYVRQDWPNWKLDAAMPMIYQKYYGEELPWIGTATSEGVREVGGRFPIYAGMQMAHVEPEELEQAVQYVCDAGAAGPAIFSFGGSQRHWAVFGKALAGS